MRILKLLLKNFRNFRHEEIALNPQFTVVIGKNGAGKSTVLQGLAVAMGKMIMQRGIEGLPNSEKDIRVIYDPTTDRLKDVYPMKVEPLEFEGIDYNEESTSYYFGIEPLDGTIEADKELDESQFSGPVALLYPTNRFGGQRLAAQPFIGQRVRQQAYHQWYALGSSHYEYERWLAGLQPEKNELHASWLEAFTHTLKTAIPLLGRLRVVGPVLWCSTLEDGVEGPELPLAYHSDGMRGMAEMVAELAYRCIILNGKEGAQAVHKARGMVLIDELDMHLHPSWQRHVVADLMAAFPGIQFVATTHSPFIVQSLEADQLYNLEAASDVAPNQLKLDQLAVQVMGVDSPFSIANEERSQQLENAAIGLANEGEEPADPVARALAHLYASAQKAKQ